MRFNLYQFDINLKETTLGIYLNEYSMNMTLVVKLDYVCTDKFKKTII